MAKYFAYIVTVLLTAVCIALVLAVTSQFIHKDDVLYTCRGGELYTVTKTNSLVLYEREYGFECEDIVK
jgi:hypothetical protein